MWEFQARRPPQSRALLALLLLPLLALPAVASANERFWVSPHGSDSAPGTKRAPFATLVQAQRALRSSLRRHPGTNVTVILRGGVYRLSRPLVLTAADSPPDGHRVIFRAYKHERPLISGAQRVSGAAWSRFDRQADIWRARVGGIESREL